MKHYGNTFNAEKVDSVGVERISLWKSAREFFPSGAVLSSKDVADTTDLATGKVKVGDIIPAGTPISVTKPGGKPTFNGTTPLGLTYEDVEMGNEGCTFTIVTMGEFLESRTKATITDDQKTYLFGRISFIKEV